MERIKRHQHQAAKRRQRQVKKHELQSRIQEIRDKFLGHWRLAIIVGFIIRGVMPLLPEREAGEKHTKLTLVERHWIYKHQNEGCGVNEIARRVNRSPSCISRELRINKPPPYCTDAYSKAKAAHDRATTRRDQPRRGRVRLKGVAVQSIVQKAIKAKKTPEKVSARLLLENGISLSHEAIYRWIYEVQRDLIQYLTRQGRRYRRNARKRSRALRQPAAPKLSIEKRSKAANERSEFGHWEVDTIVSKQSTACLLVLQERLSRYFFVVKLPACSADEARSAVIRLLLPLCKDDMVKSLTCDNGPENWGHDEISRALGLPVYFCHPYCSSERGGVENRNGVLRRFFPKKTNFDLVSNEEITQVWDDLVNRPMRCLGYLTPYEIFHQTFVPILEKAA